MDYEKAYKEALELMKGCIPDGNGFVNIRPCDIFPELKESEDERIRQRIIHALHGDVLEMSEIKEAIAWLEKQGEQKEATCVAETIDRLSETGTITFEEFLNEFCKRAKIYDIELPNRSYDIYALCNELYSLLVKQKPQGKSALEAAKEEKVDNQNCVKPADEVKPKFKKE